MADNAAVVRDFIAAWSRLDVEELVGFFTEDGVYHNMPIEPVQGHAALRQFIGAFAGGWSSTEWEVLNLLSAGDVVIAERVDRTIVGGKPVNLPCCGVFELRDGKIAVWRDYFDMSTYTRALAGKGMERWLPAATGEWRDGWRIVLGCAMASATGVALLFFTFSLFLLPLAEELNVSRGQLGIVQALIITAALGSPVIGRMTDIYGFRPVYFTCTLIVATIQITTALLGSSIWHMAISIALTGFFSVGSTAVAITRPISAHFRVHRGKALGLVAVGASVTTMFMPPILQEVLDAYSWRGGFIALAAISVCIGIPSVALLLPRNAGRSGSGIGGKSPPPDYAFLKVPDFWFMTLSNVVMSMATAGAVSQMSPMIQEEGISAATAALALSVYAVGQFAGRLGGGWLLDRFEPRRVAFLLTLVPGMGFMVLLLTTGFAPAALFAAAMIGLQQGAELDIFAYFVSRRFEVSKYGTVYGALVGIGWIGNAVGIIGVGLLHDATGSYAICQAIGSGALLVGALLILPVRLPAREEAG